MAILIKPYQSSLASDAISVVLPIQRDEFGFEITVDDQPDLKDVPSLYHQGKGEFWLAYDNNTPVGTIGLHDIDGENGALRKMFVVASHRGKDLGIATRLLQTLESHAKTSGLSAIFLGTSETFKAAHRFYEKSGYKRVLSEQLPSGFLKMGADTRFYRKFL